MPAVVGRMTGRREGKGRGRETVGGRVIDSDIVLPQRGNS